MIATQSSDVDSIGFSDYYSRPPTISRVSNVATGGSTRQRSRQPDWSSLGSLNSFGDSNTTPPSSQEPATNNGIHPTGNVQQQARETLHSRFEFKQTLGKGTYGKVKLALDKRKNEQVAIKTIKKSRIENPHDLARIRREIDFMTSLNHPHIIKIKEVYESREKIILVMDYASGGELYDYLNRMKRIPEPEARTLFRQIVSAVHFLHKNHIVHRDLKLENILIDQKGDIKLADFGLSNSWSPRRLLHTFCGSPLYASPEIVSGIPYYGPEVDCWSLGVLLYTLVYGSMPFQGGDYNRLVRNITSGEFIQPREQSGAFSLIQYCLKSDANTRATTKDMLRHDWLVHGSVPLNSTGTTTASSLVPVASKSMDNSISPSNSLVELELHTSSFFDTTRLRENPPSYRDQRRHRASAIPVSTRYVSSNNPALNLSTSRTAYRRPISLALDDPPSTSETSQAQSMITRRTASPTYVNNDRYQSPPTHRYTLATSSESTTSQDCKRQVNPRSASSTNDVNIGSNIPSSAQCIAPSVFTTSAIKFAPAPIRRDPESITPRLVNNPLSNSDEKTKLAASSTNDYHRRSLLTFMDSPPPPPPPPTTTNLSKQHLLDDNNNFISLRIYD